MVTASPQGTGPGTERFQMQHTDLIENFDARDGNRKRAMKIEGRITHGFNPEIFPQNPTMDGKSDALLRGSPIVVAEAKASPVRMLCVMCIAHRWLLSVRVLLPRCS